MSPYQFDLLASKPITIWIVRKWLNMNISHVGLLASYYEKTLAMVCYPSKTIFKWPKTLYKWFDNEVNPMQVVCKQFASSSKTVHIILENIRLDYIRF